MIVASTRSRHRSTISFTTSPLSNTAQVQDQLKLVRAKCIQHPFHLRLEAIAAKCGLHTVAQRQTNSSPDTGGAITIAWLA
jgi:hypothetical protein